MRRHARPWFLVLLILLPAALLGPAGCSNAPQPGELPGEEGDFRRAERTFQQGRYLQAIEALDGFRTEHPGSDRIDDAIFLLGLAHAKQGDNLLARDEFERLLRDYPQSEHREEAQFERAMAWLADSRGPALDPEPTQEAQAAFRAYLQVYPEGVHGEEAARHLGECLDRLAVKAYLNGKTYLDLKRGEAARIYFEKSLSILPTSSRAGDAMAGLARAHRLRLDLDASRAAWHSLLEYATPERIEREPRLEKLRREAERELAREEAASPGGS